MNLPAASPIARRRAFLALLAGCALLVAGAPAAGASTATYGAQFAVDDVDPWGGAGGAVHSARELYETPAWNVNGGASDSDTFLDMKFGGSIGGSTTGQLGLEFGYDASNGKLDIDYPALVDVTYPEDETYFPGDTIRIDTVNRSTAGTFDFDPGDQAYDITSSLAFTASASGELCFIGCGSFDFFPPILVPRTELEVLSARAGAGVYGTNVYTPPPGAAAAHVTGNVTPLKPDVSLDVATQGQMYANSSQDFAGIDMDIDAFSKYPFGKSVGGRGVALSYDVFDGKLHLAAKEQHTFDFKPAVRMTFDFPRSVGYRVVTAGAPGALQTGTSATINAGQSLDLVVPVDLTQPFSITPTLSLQNSLQHKLVHDYRLSGEIKVLQANATIDGWEVAGTTVVPDISFGFGPVYRTSIPIPVATTPTLFDDTWAVPFASHVQAARAFDPENIPVADAGGPYDVNEGSQIDLDATASFDYDADDDPLLTYAWSLDSPGTLEATGVTPQFDALDGDHTYVATVKVCDLKRNCHSDTAKVNVHNVVPSHVLDTASTIAFGVGQAYLGRVGVPVTHAATAGDTGTDDTTYTWAAGAFAAWTPPGTTYFNNGASPDPDMSAFGTLPFPTSSSSSVTFSQPGVFDLVLVVSDDDGGATTTSVPVLLADTSTTHRPSGWFKQQYSLQGARKLTTTQLDAYLAFTRAGSSYWSERQPLTTHADAYAVLQKLDTTGSTVLDQARASTLTAWLNVASGAVAFNKPLPTRVQQPGRITTADALRELEGVMAGPATHAQLVAAMQLANAIG